MVARLAPEDGDVVVRQEKREGQRTYVLRTAPGPDQSLLRSREEAVSHAVAYAKRQHVRAWFTKGDDAFVLLGTFREEKMESESV
jgi:hypothetical protein